jgi:hypothetical protein
MPSSGMLRRVTLVRTDVSEEVNASLIRVTRIDEPETTRLASVSGYVWRCSWLTNSCHSDDGGANILRNFVSYKSHMA